MSFPTRSLKLEPPEWIQLLLREQKVSLEAIRIAFVTDINSRGEYDPQWLVVTSDSLFVFEPSERTGPFLRFEMSELEAFRAEAAVGSGLLQGQVEGVWLDLIRFSNRLKYSFDRILKRLEQIRKGEPLLPFEADEQDPHRCPQCGLMLEFSGELCTRCIDSGAALGRVLRLMQPYWRSTFILSAVLFLGITLDMIWPLLTRYLVDHVLSESGRGDPPPFLFMRGRSVYELLLLVVAALAAVHLIRAALNLLSGRITSRVSNAMTFDIRARLVRKFEELGLAYYSRQETGSLVGRTAYDTDAIQGFLTQITSGFFMQFLLVIFSFAMMFTLEPQLALWAIVPAPFVIAGAFLYWRHVHPHFQRFWDRSSKQAGLLNGILSGIRVVKAFGQEENEFRRFQVASMEVRQTREKLDRTGAYFHPLMAIVFQVGGWIIWYVGGHQVLQTRVSLGTLMAFFGYLGMFYGPLGSLTNLTTWLTQFSTQMHRIFEVLNTPAVLPMAHEPLDPPRARGEVEFQKVTFGYSRGSPILKNLSLQIRSGERIGIVGRSGSGKTSLINLICRFYDVDDGAILMDGVDLRSLSKDALRSRISIVLQEPFLFHGTLAENVLYGRPSASLEEVIEAARAANAHDFIMQHPLTYDSSVGERGQELSGGERQRISIARAILCDTPILILDEATSSIDSESELAIQQALRTMKRERTLILIAHRLSTLRDCDRIYVIENGGVLESGNHDELMTRNGRYASWVRIQEGENPVKYGESSKGPGGSAHLRTRWLKPGQDELTSGLRQELQVRLSGESPRRGIFALRCFPVHHPEEYISLRRWNASGRIEEIGMIRDLRQWSSPVRRLVQDSLNRRYFFHQITRIHSIRKTTQFLEFQAATAQGRLEFTLRYEPDSAQRYGRRGKLLMDVEDNLYLISDLKKLRRPDRALLDRYIYW